jgi:hypothetical protein
MSSILRCQTCARCNRVLINVWQLTVSPKTVKVRRKVLVYSCIKVSENERPNGCDHQCFDHFGIDSYRIYQKINQKWYQVYNFSLLNCLFKDILHGVSIFVVVMEIKSGFSENLTNTDFAFQYSNFGFNIM